MERADARTPVTVVTGFLGSGKTTLLNRALRSPRLVDAAVIINEFGSVPLDHLLSEASDDQIVVLENGCLCCTVFGDLIATLNRLYHARAAGEITRFDRVIIETSGLADPRPVLQAFLSDPTLEGLYRLDSVLAVLDAVNGPGTLERHDEAVHQLALADRVVISKLDLLGRGEAGAGERKLRQILRGINPTAQVHLSIEPAMDPVELLVTKGFSPARDAGNVLHWLGSAAFLSSDDDNSTGNWSAGTGDAHAPGRHGQPKIGSFCLVRNEAVSQYGLELLLAAVERNLGPSLLRLKGLVQVSERPDRPAVIQGAQHLLHNLTWLERWPSEDRTTRIVFITTGIGRSELEEMVGVLDRMARRTAIARERQQT